MNPLIQIVRASIEANLKNEKYSPGAEDQSQASGIFVTLWKKHASGEKVLRGCIGRHQRKFTELSQEVADCAVLSATQDPRFMPVDLSELPQLSVEISLLSPPEKISDISQLDPMRFGVIVKCGMKQATLLPDIDGVETTSQQLEIVYRKAGITSQEVKQKQVEYFRFEVRKVSEGHDL